VNDLTDWLIFDAMGVIYEVGDDTRDLLIPYIKRRKPEMDEKRIHDVYLQASLGEISSQEFWRSLDFTDWRAVEKNYLDTCLALDPCFVKVAERLADSYHLAMLSNDLGEWSAYLRKRFDLNRLFKVVIISGDVGLRKPDRRIYELLLSEINAPAENCIFFDDRVKNLIPAKELGIKPALFNRDQVDNSGFLSVNGFLDIEAAISKLNH